MKYQFERKYNLFERNVVYERYALVRDKYRDKVMNKFDYEVEVNSKDKGKQPVEEERTTNSERIEYKNRNNERQR